MFFPAMMLAVFGCFSHDGHEWEAINYDPFDVDQKRWKVDARIDRIVRKKRHGFELVLDFRTGKPTHMPLPLPKIKVTLHSTGGRVGFPQKTKSLLNRHSCFFRWQENDMDDYWFRVEIRGVDYWLLIPYGFTRYPFLKQLPENAGGGPQLTEDIDYLAKNCRLCIWKNVEYDFGKIKKKWRLNLIHENPFDASTEVFLYRDTKKRWQLHKPRTRLHIDQGLSYHLKSFPQQARIDDSRMHRIELFKFSRNGGDDLKRNWGKLVIQVGDLKIKKTVPSSLFKYCHGCLNEKIVFAIRDARAND